MTADELKAMEKGRFVVMKTGQHPMRTRLRLFFEWGITFEEAYIVPKRQDTTVYYAGRKEMEERILKKYGYREDKLISRSSKASEDKEQSGDDRSSGTQVRV